MLEIKPFTPVTFAVGMLQSMLFARRPSQSRSDIVRQPWLLTDFTHRHSTLRKSSGVSHLMKYSKDLSPKSKGHHPKSVYKNRLLTSLSEV